jgi:two-component system NtrC family sensor kinase
MQQSSAILSTFDKAEQERVLAALTTSNILEDLASQDTVGTVFKVAAGNELYLGTAVRLNRVTGGSKAQILYLIINPVEQELSRALRPILGTFGIVSLIFLVLTSIIGHLISLGITKPINALVQGTTEVSKGNYDYAIAVEGRDELSFLAQKFAEMSKSLKEKINELDRLNKDLIERNVDLDETLKKLKDAQEELVQSERLAATGKLTAQLAHEINNPIHNIQSCLKTSLSRLPEEMQGRELVEVAYDEITRMSKLTRQLLDFYRTSLVTDEMEPVRLNEVLREVLTSFQDELRNSRIAFATELDPELSKIHGSKDKLKQVFINIILNAKDAMPQGGTLRIVSLAENGFAKVSVSDSGVGIPRENLSKIFDAFFTTKGKVSGVGLGLSVSYGIINQHSGTISVKSTVGEGSTFTISLPLIQETITTTTA